VPSFCALVKKTNDVKEYFIFNVTNNETNWSGCTESNGVLILEGTHATLQLNRLQTISSPQILKTLKNKVLDLPLTLDFIRVMCCKQRLIYESNKINY
jgi:hypothetical protein